MGRMESMKSTNYNEIYSNPFLLERISSPSIVNLKININEEHMGNFVLKFNFWNDLTFVEYLPTKEANPIIQGELALYTIHFVFLVNNNLLQVVKTMNKLQQIEGIKLTMED